jgi:hypothetical protein
MIMRDGNPHNPHLMGTFLTTTEGATAAKVGSKAAQQAAEI